MRTTRRRDIAFYHLGNGLSVCDRLHEKDGDYEKLAHIAPDRTITWYVKNLPLMYRERIEREAKESNPAISESQPDQKVFSNPPTL